MQTFQNFFCFFEAGMKMYLFSIEKVFNRLLDYILYYQFMQRWLEFMKINLRFTQNHPSQPTLFPPAVYEPISANGCFRELWKLKNGSTSQFLSFSKEPEVVFITKILLFFWFIFKENLLINKYEESSSTVRP